MIVRNLVPLSHHLPFFRVLFPHSISVFVDLNTLAGTASIPSCSGHLVLFVVVKPCFAESCVRRIQIRYHLDSLSMRFFIGISSNTSHPFSTWGYPSSIYRPSWASPSFSRTSTSPFTHPLPLWCFTMSSVGGNAHQGMGAQPRTGSRVRPPHQRSAYLASPSDMGVCVQGTC